jgi:molybdate transport system permease protein
LRRAPIGGLAALAGTLLLLLLGLPVALLLARGIGVALQPEEWPTTLVSALLLSFVTSAAALVVCIALGTPLAWLLARRRFPLASLVESLVDLPIVLPPAVAGLALLLLLGRNGPVGGLLAERGISLPFTTAAVVVAQIFVSAPFYVRAARAGFASVPEETEDAARADGAGEIAVARHVTLPLAAAALSSGAVTAWARSLGEFGATIMFAGNVVGRTQTLPLMVYSEFQSGLEGALAAATILVVAALAVLVAVRVFGWHSIGELRSLG